MIVTRLATKCDPRIPAMLFGFGADSAMVVSSISNPGYPPSFVIRPICLVLSGRPRITEFLMVTFGALIQMLPLRSIESMTVPALVIVISPS